MIRHRWLFVAVAFVIVFCFWGEQGFTLHAQEMDFGLLFEDPLIRRAEQEGYWSEDRYEIARDQNPYYLRGDFDGDGRADVAVRVRDKSTSNRAIFIVHSSADTVIVLGDGRLTPEGRRQVVGGYWRVLEKGTVVHPIVTTSSGIEYGESLELVQDGLEVGNRGGHSVLYYWLGDHYKIFPLSD